MHDTREGIWKGDILVADIEELGRMDASEIHAKRLNAKEMSPPKHGENFVFSVADGSLKMSGGDQDLRTPMLFRDDPDRGEERENFRGESEGSSSTQRQDSTWYDGEAREHFWSLFGDFIYRHHVEHRVKLYVPNEESFPIPLEYIDVSRTTYTTFERYVEEKY